MITLYEGAYGKINFYIKSGRLNFIVGRVSPYGIGNLYQQFLKLKENKDSLILSNFFERAFITNEILTNEKYSRYIRLQVHGHLRLLLGESCLHPFYSYTPFFCTRHTTLA